MSKTGDKFWGCQAPCVTDRFLILKKIRLRKNTANTYEFDPFHVQNLGASPPLE